MLEDYKSVEKRAIPYDIFSIIS